MSQPDIRSVASTGSTNDDVAALARDGAPQGLWLRADAQTIGRGRHGRAWVSDPGNLYASTLVRLAAGDPPAPTLALVAAVALEELAGALVDPHRLMLKWPNDLLLDGAKLSGILLDRAGDAVVIGFGVNLTRHPRDIDRAAISLAAGGIAPPAPDAFLIDLAAAFSRWLARWRGEGLGPVRRRWLERAHPPGTALAIRMPGGEPVDGLFDGLEPDGALRLRLADGAVRVMHAGDVNLL